LSGSFSNPGALFSVSGTWQDYQWQMDFSPNLPDMTVTWSCDENYCEGWGGGGIAGGAASGQVWSLSLNTLLYTFSGAIFGGSASREAGHCVVLDECPSYTYDQYSFEARGLWSNGWSTVGSDYATDFESYWNGTYESDLLGLFTLTTQTPEPCTLTLIGVGLTVLYARVKRS